MRVWRLGRTHAMCTKSLPIACPPRCPRFEDLNAPHSDTPGTQRNMPDRLVDVQRCMYSFSQTFLLGVRLAQSMDGPAHIFCRRRRCLKSSRRERNLVALERKDFRRQLQMFQKWQTDNKELRRKVKQTEAQVGFGAHTKQKVPKCAKNVPVLFLFKKQHVYFEYIVSVPSSRRGLKYINIYLYIYIYHPTEEHALHDIVVYSPHCVALLSDCQPENRT